MAKLNIKKFLLIMMPIAALILELLPNGVVLRFANPDGDPWVRTYSHFDMMPFGYANFGPLIAAVLTCVLLLLSVIYFFKPCKGLNTAMMNVSGFATVAAFAPLMFGTDYLTVIGIIVGLLLAATFGICFMKGKQ
ncbi:MAG: hypothetical protein IJZ03_00235 [Clostridia bacterium]|nr:hypothetical protein [Clostridia bacterium]